MFIVDVLMPWDDIPNMKVNCQETFSGALNAAERIVQESGGARSIEIFEADSLYAKNKRLIAVLRTIR